MRAYAWVCVNERAYACVNRPAYTDIMAVTDSYYRSNAVLITDILDYAEKFLDLEKSQFLDTGMAAFSENE